MENNPNGSSLPEDKKAQPAPTGNASNPSEQNEAMTPASNQLLDEKAEKYLREVASIEDVPDAQDEQDAENDLSQNT